MKKFFIILFVFVLVMNLQSQDYELKWELEPEQMEKKPFRLGNRAFEMGILNINAGFANNFLGANEIFRETLILDFENLNRGFNLTFDVDLRPIYFNINAKDRWGFGLDIANVTAYGNIDISGALLQFRKSDGEQFGAGAAAFADVGIPIFFHVNNIRDRNLRISFRPAGFVPVAYTVPDMKYTYKDIEVNGQRGSIIEIDYRIKIHTPLSLEPLLVDDNNDNVLSTLNVSSALGLDFSLGAEYPLFSFLDVGVNFTNIPLSRSTLNNYMEVRDKIMVDSSKIDLADFFGDNDIPDEAFYFSDDFDPVFGNEAFRVARPFKTIFYANYRPFDTQTITLIPSLGFSVNPLFVQSFAPEIGGKVRFDLINMFITTIGVGYEDQMWRNGLDLIFNLRAFEIGVGVSMQSQQFLKSWQAAGLRANLAVKFGF
jgi:hypothetical protein